jgi:hypothetical protein
MERKQWLPPLKVASDGYWVLPVGEVPASCWMRGSKGDRPLEGWGPHYFAIRTPSSTIPPTILHRLFVEVKALLEGDGVSHKAIVPYMANDHARSEFDARHIGIIGHYGKDDIGPHGIRLSKDTLKQGGVEMDAIHRLFVTLQQEVCNIINYQLRHIDPIVYQFQQA